MKVITLNANGLRAAAKKGVFDWLNQQQADVICLQEVRYHEAQLKPQFELLDYKAYFCHAEKKGYSGVAIYTRTQPNQVTTQLGWSIADQEGRYLQLDFGDLSIASIYFPSGTSGEARQQCKFDFLHRYQSILEKQRQDGRRYILCGDWNIAHRPIDLKNWQSNQKHSGFLPEERAWLDHILGPLGYIDAFRNLEAGPEHYTWWSHYGRAWENNTGWRIDYQIITPNLKNTLRSTSIYKAQRFSDHAPLIVEYDIILNDF
jgi:exodeoxyribonuclease-3